MAETHEELMSIFVIEKQDIMDQSWKSRITVNPRQCGGRPCIRGMRIRVTDILDLLAAGLTQQQILEELPDLEKEDIEAALRYLSIKYTTGSRPVDLVTA